MIEDDSYKTSSQYRLWSFTHDALQKQRIETNRLATEKVRAAFLRNGSVNTTSEIDTLTPTEEQTIVQWYCSKILDTRSLLLHPQPTSEVIATATQYLRRFYVYNSPMTYHPKSIMVSCLWLAYKAEHFRGKDRLGQFAKALDVEEEEVRAPEFLIMQALRFTLDVRHPMRGLDGGIAEMRLRCERGELKLFSGVGEKRQEMSVKEALGRIGKVGDGAKKLLKVDAQMTDAYFFYTPAQMWLAALYAVDEELVRVYIGHLIDRLGTSVGPIKQKLLDTLSACTELFKSYETSKNDQANGKALGRIGKKLKKCQNPEKVDIVAVAREKMAEKREVSESDLEKKAKKRKLEKEALEKDGDVFGPDLKSAKKG